MGKINGAADLYDALIEMKNTDNIKAVSFTKAKAKKAGIDWSFVEDAALILGLKIIKSGHGYLIAKP